MDSGMALPENDYLFLCEVQDDFVEKIDGYVYMTTDEIDRFTTSDDETSWGVTNFPKERIKILYTFDSLDEAKIKFEELKESEPYKSWIIDKEATKYNI